MSTYTYIQKDTKGIYVEFDSKRDKKALRIGTSWEDYAAGLWVLLTEEQVAFRKANPDASLQEVFSMRLTPAPEPPPPPVRTLEQAKAEKVMAIDVYDTSDAVNSFEFNGIGTWVSVADRSYLNDAIKALETKGVSVMEVPLLGQFFTLPTAMVKSLLADIEIYAYKASIQTAKHKAAVNSLSTVEEVDAYDFTVGYPEKVTIAL
jgi:hypothetical protein